MPSWCECSDLPICTLHVSVRACLEAEWYLSGGQNAIQAQDNEAAETEAIAIALRLKEDGALRGYGAAQQVPKRIYTLEELRLNRIDAEQFLSPEDTTLNGVRTTLQVTEGTSCSTTTCHTLLQHQRCQPRSFACLHPVPFMSIPCLPDTPSSFCRTHRWDLQRA